MTPTNDHAPLRLRPTTSAGELLTLAEAADLLRTPIATLRYWRHLGIGPAGFKLGKRILFAREDLDIWLDTKRNQQQQPGDFPGDAA